MARTALKARKTRSCKPRRQTNMIDHNLFQFCAAIREKKDWQTKVFDEALALKWAIEAELLPLDSENLTGDAFEAIRHDSLNLCFT